MSLTAAQRTTLERLKQYGSVVIRKRDHRSKAWTYTALDGPAPHVVTPIIRSIAEALISAGALVCWPADLRASQRRYYLPGITLQLELARTTGIQLSTPPGDPVDNSEPAEPAESASMSTSG